jgi:DNA-binding LacI/PurR family transcriptional regulator
MKSKSATLEDVARHAGVSYQTVSRVLNKSANVSEATRHKVEKSIELLRYVPNRLAQQLVGKQSQTVGLVTISLATPLTGGGCGKTLRQCGRIPGADLND